LNGLASLYLEIGLFEKAEKLYLESLSLLEKIVGMEHADYLTTVSNLAILYTETGHFDKAEPIYLKAISTQVKTLGKNHKNYSWNLNNLEALSINKRILGNSHPEYAGILINLAGLYFESGQFVKVESLYLEAKKIFEDQNFMTHPYYSNCLNNLGALYMDLKQYEKAEKLNLETKAIWEKVLGKENSKYAICLNNLGWLYYKLGQFGKAESYYLQAKNIQEKIFGKENFDYARSLKNLAILYSAMNNYKSSDSLWIEHSKVNKELLNKAIRHLSEVELNNYLNQFTRSQDQLLSVTQLHESSNLAMASNDNILFYKGFLLNSVSRIKRLAYSDSITANKYNLLRTYQKILAIELSKPLINQDSLKISELLQKSNEIEKYLIQSVANYGNAIRQINWKDVQNALKSNEASIEFVQYNLSNETEESRSMYSAIVITSRMNSPLFISLFEQHSLDSLMALSSLRKADYVNNLYTLVDRGVISVEAAKRSLYDILWKPLEKELTGIKTIYYSPSGLLHRINLDAIPVSETETLADRYNLVELNSTRQLAIPTQIKNVNNDAILYGGIQFDQDTTLKENEHIIATRSQSELSFSNIDSTLRGGNWNYLVGTEREVNAIEKIMQTTGVKTKLKKGYEATEESFKNIGENNNPSPRILHIATHGYFFADPKEKVGSSRLAVGIQEPVFKISDHPMLRSGLIMAGGNATWQGKQTLEGREDGILTAYEISQMNLSNTELVVLSACETGLGDIQGNEGVYGLQRAFKIAGAKYLIMSLWQVPDKQTSLLMTTFYKKWLEEKMSIPNAFHAAQKELRDAGLDPYQWAGFVLME
jgi:CHAT domain-containing protein/Tfp pilus assembly protein PilF